MSDYVDHNRQAAYGAEFFDFDAASGEYDNSMLSSDAVDDFGMGNIAWNENLNDFSMANNDQAASCQTFGGFATDTAWPGMEPTDQHHQAGSSTAYYDLPEEANLWTSDSSNFQNNDYAFQSSAPTETHDHPNFDTLRQTLPASSQWHAESQQLQGSRMVVDGNSVLPAEGHQSE